MGGKSDCIDVLLILMNFVLGVCTKTQLVSRFVSRNSSMHDTMCLCFPLRKTIWIEILRRNKMLAN